MIHPKEKFLLKSDVFRLLSLAIAYPDDTTQRRLMTIAEALKDSEKLDSNSRKLVEKLYNELNKDFNILNEYSSIFIKGGLAINEGTVSSKFNAVSDVSAFYSAFGFNPKNGESPDSLMHELEFAALLALKIAIAPTTDTEEIALDAFNKFLQDHLSEFALKFSENLRKGDANDFYQTYAKLLTHTVQNEVSLIINS